MEQKEQENEVNRKRDNKKKEEMKWICVREDVGERDILLLNNAFYV